LLAVTTERFIGCSEHRRMTMNLHAFRPEKRPLEIESAETTDRQEWMAAITSSSGVRAGASETGPSARMTTSSGAGASHRHTG
jgi:hypothetical protein